MHKKLLIVVLMTILLGLQISASIYEQVSYSDAYEIETMTEEGSGSENSTTLLDVLLSTWNTEEQTSISSEDSSTTSITTKWSTLHNADYVVSNNPDYPDNTDVVDLTTKLGSTTVKTTTINPDRVITIDKDQDSSFTNIIIAIFVVVVIIFALIIGGLYAFSLFSLWF